MGRAAHALIFAVIGAGLALLDYVFLADPARVPQTTAGWTTFYVALCLPWAVLGAIIGFSLGKRRASKF
jgi:hypothetical protein